MMKSQEYILKELILSAQEETWPLRQFFALRLSKSQLQDLLVYQMIHQMFKNDSSM